MEVRLKALAVERITGSARFTSPSRVAVQQDDGVTPFIEFRNAVIATGSRPALFAGLPADDDRVIDSTGALALTELPRNLAVIGAGSIGVELATAFAKLGVEVTVVEREDRILPEFPAFIARPVAQRLGQLGVTIHLGVSVVGLSDDGLACRFAGNDVAVPCDKVLVAVGRRPNTDGIGCDAARIPLGDDGRVVVGPDRLIPGSTIAAIGDITAGSMLAHKASAEAVVAAEALCGRRVAFDPAAIPLVVYSDPEVASAGYSRDSARADGIAAQAVTVPLAALGRAATMAAVEGFTQLVVDVDRNAVIGVHIVGPHASELICAGVLAIEMAATPDDLAATVHAHPTLSEGLHEAARRWITQTK
jgi:dihydrolipoamide dehydrogenase